MCTFCTATREVSLEYLGDTNETWRLSLFRCSEYEAKLSYQYLRANMTALTYSCHSIKWYYLRCFGAPQFECTLLLPGATDRSNACVTYLSLD